MKYVGSKNRIAKEILPTMLTQAKGTEIYWVEPFVGGANLIDKVPDKFIKIGNDKHEYLIALLQKLQEGYIPPSSISQIEYYRVKQNPENYDKHYVGFVGFCTSFSGKW